ncbi:MAG: ribonuclease R [Saprospiraceae bacterium]|nr:ribonuclease R [Saprospiraceae bacterium]
MLRKPRQLKSEELQIQILKLLSKNASKSFDTYQISRKINVSNPPSSIQEELNKLVTKGLVIKTKTGIYRINSAQKTSSDTKSFFQGYVDMTRSGAAYITNTDAREDIYVAPNYISGALHKDLVKVEIIKKLRNRRLEGKIVEIVERSISQVIGTLTIYDNYATVKVDYPKNFPEVNVQLNEIKQTNSGSFVKVEITNWGKGQNKAIWGKIISVLNKEDENEIAMQNILLSNGFEIEFSEEVLKETKNLHLKINVAETQKRRDFREKICFTIDPLTAKDFDDALSLHQLENGHFEIGIHIADVTHFLDENSELDKEAFTRSTSVYIADRVCPMLPEELSNHLCSLTPNEDKYTFSAVFEMDEEGRIFNEWFGKTIIHSCRRFTYEEAQERIENEEGDYANEINLLNHIAKKLRKIRFDNGSISFESDEVQFVYDTHMVPLEIKIRERKDAHMLVEDFMLLANKKVAEYMYKLATPAIPYIYRIHDLPNPEKLSDFADYAKELGFTFYGKTPSSITDSFNRLAKEISENETLKLLEPMAIRTMSKAEYSPHNIGHYGLGFDFYTHFTSPIRRYADVIAHRVLYKNLEGSFRADLKDLELKTKHISLQERKAMDAERESIKYKLVEYMSFHIGEKYEGVVSGMIEKGIFIEILETKAEGFIPFDDLPGTYVLAENKFRAWEKRGKDDFYIGKKIWVMVLDANKNTQKIQLKIMTN